MRSGQRADGDDPGANWAGNVRFSAQRLHRPSSVPQLHFTWVSDWAAVAPVLSLIEERLAPLDARPHWGKLFRTSPCAVPGLYPRLGDFRQLRQHFDPLGKFRNGLVDRYLVNA
jgi:D-arabinono-1,4-lactone oxidase